MGIWVDIKNSIVHFFRKEPPPQYEVTEYVFSDRQPLDGSSTISFFINNLEPDVSVTRTFDSEDQAVNWLMNNQDFKRMLFSNLFSSSDSVKYYCGVKEPITTPNIMPGDIDIILYEQGKEQNAVGIECKIVKSESRKNQSPKINKVASVQKKGTIQANGYAELGFSRVYLLVILLDDGRHYNNPNVMFRTTPSEWLNELYGFDWQTRMNDNIGIIYAHVNQFTSNHINQTNGLGLRFEREAIYIKQDMNFTEKIHSLKN